MRHDQITGVLIAGDRAEAGIGEVEGLLAAKMQSCGGDECHAHISQWLLVLCPAGRTQRCEVFAEQMFAFVIGQVGQSDHLFFTPMWLGWRAYA